MDWLLRRVAMVWTAMDWLTWTGCYERVAMDRLLLRVAMDWLLWTGCYGLVAMDGCYGGLLLIGCYGRLLW